MYFSFFQTFCSGFRTDLAGRKKIRPPARRFLSNWIISEASSRPPGPKSKIGIVQEKTARDIF